jgi:hypothetical protein
MAMQVGDRVYVEGNGYGYIASPAQPASAGRYDWNVILDFKGFFPAKESELTLVEQVVVEGKVDASRGLDDEISEVLTRYNGEEVRITIERKRTTKEASKRES